MAAACLLVALLALPGWRVLGALAGEPAQRAEVCREHVMLQRTELALGRVLSASAHANMGSCHTAVEGEACYQQVKWAMDHGRPDGPTGMSFETTALFKAVQAFFHVHHYHDGSCPMPCWTWSWPFVSAGCHTLSREECCGNRDGRPMWFGQACLVVENSTTPARDMDLPCQPEGWVGLPTGWQGSVVGCPAPSHPILPVEPFVAAGCHTLRREECCGRRDGRLPWFGHACVVVQNVTAPARDVSLECQPEGWVSGRTEWRGEVVGCRAGEEAPAPRPAPPPSPGIAVVGCHTLGREECCGMRDGRAPWFGQPCVVVQNVTAPPRDISLPCQPEGWVSGITEWYGDVVGCGEPGLKLLINNTGGGRLGINYTITDTILRVGSVPTDLALEWNEHHVRHVEPGSHVVDVDGVRGNGTRMSMEIEKLRSHVIIILPAPAPTPPSAPTAAPTAVPTAAPTAPPTAAPTVAPTTAPSAVPTPAPTSSQAPRTLPQTTPEPESTTMPRGRDAPGSPGLCAAFGDPHFITFDGGHTVFVGEKVFWLVKSQSVWVQGLARGSEGKLLGVAVGGPFLRGHALVVRKEGPSSLAAAFDGEAILREPVGEFRGGEVLEGYREESWKVGLHNDDVLRLRTERQFAAGPWPERFLGRPEGGVYLFRLPGGVELTVTGVDYMSLVLTMPAQPGGQGGFCGNFNGRASDDAEPVVPSWNRPIGPDLGPVPAAESLFGAAAAAAAHVESETQAFQRFLAKLRECKSELRELALRRCRRVGDLRIREDCIFDVCMTGSLKVSENALAAEVLEQKVNARGIPVLLGPGRCHDASGRPYAAFAAVPRPPHACPDVLRGLAAVEGVRGAQFCEATSTCQILVEKGVDPRPAEVDGAWGAPERTDAGGEGRVSGASGDPQWSCWQLD